MISEQEKKTRTCAVLCGDPTAAISRRLQLMREFIRHYDRCYLICPTQHPEAIRSLKEMGYHFLPVEFANQGINVLADSTLVLRLLKVLRCCQPDDLFVFHMKPILFGSLAAIAASIPRKHYLFAGLGVLFADRGGIKARFVSRCVEKALSIGLGGATNLFFQNEDDVDTLLRCGVLKHADQVVVVNGSGVDLDEFAWQEVNDALPLEFLVVTRMLRSKGILEFCEAARRVRSASSGKAKFTLLGPLDEGPDGLRLKDLRPWITSGDVEYLGVTDDVRPFLGRASVIVLPSYYMEGTPRVLLEALSTGRPIITTDHRGCRETVEDDSNGLLIKPRSIDALVDAFEWIICHPDVLVAWGTESRRIAEKRYDVRAVNQAMLTRILNPRPNSD